MDKKVTALHGKRLHSFLTMSESTKTQMFAIKYKSYLLVTELQAILMHSKCLLKKV